MVGTAFDRLAKAASTATGRRGALGLAAGLVLGLAATPAAAGDPCRRKARQYRANCEAVCDRDCTFAETNACCKADCAKCAAKFAACRSDAGRRCNERHQDTFVGFSEGGGIRCGPVLDACNG